MLVAYLYLPRRFKYRTSHKDTEARIMLIVQNHGFLEKYFPPRESQKTDIHLTGIQFMRGRCM